MSDDHAIGPVTPGALPPLRYHAFISYSHAVDLPVADALQREVRRFGVPWYRHQPSVPGTPSSGAVRPLRIFRDVSDLSASPGLWQAILTALAASEWLILMASPASARSPWVAQELAWWKAHRSPDRILIALVDGELAWKDGDVDWDVTDAVSREMAGVFTEAPRWVDLRALRRTSTGATATRPGGRRAKLRLGDIVVDFAAPIRGVDKDSLVGEQVRRRRHTRRTIRGVVALLTVLTIVATGSAVVALWQRASAIDQRDTALANQMVAEAAAVQDSQPGLARQLLVAARRIKLTPQVAGALTGGHAIAQELHVAADTFAYRPDGQVLATVRGGNIEQKDDDGSIRPASDGQVVFHDPKDLTVLATKSLGQLPVTGISFGPPPTQLFALTYGHDVQIWDVGDARTPTEVGRLVGHSDTVLAVAWSPDGQTVATASRDGEIRLWDVRDPRNPTTLSLLPFEVDFARYRLRFQPGGQTLAMLPALLRRDNPAVPEAVAVTLSDQPAPMVLIDVTEPRRPLPAIGDAGPITTFAFAPDGERLITSAPEGVRRWEVDPAGKASGATALPMPDATVTVNATAYGAGGRLAAVGEDGAVRLWEEGPDGALALVNELPVSDFDARNVQGLEFSPDGRRLAMLGPSSNAGADGTGVSAGTLRIWNVVDGRQRGAVSAVEGQPVISPDGHLLASFTGRVIRLWDIADIHRPRLLATVDSPGTVGGAAFSADGHTLAAYADDIVWAVDLGDPRRPRPFGGWRIEDRRHACDQWASIIPCQMVATSIAFHNERIIAVGDMTAQVSLFDITKLATTTPVGVLPVYGMVSDLVTIGGKERPLLVVGVLAGVIEIWDISDPLTPAKVGDLGGGTYQMQDLGTNSAGDVLAGAYRDGTVWVWQLRDRGRELRNIASLTDTGDVNAVALSANGRRLATLGRDRTLRGYDLAGERVTLGLVVHVGPVVEADLAFVANDHTLAIGTEHGNVGFWETDADVNADALCVGVGRPVTREQWSRAAPGIDYRPPC